MQFRIWHFRFQIVSRWLANLIDGFRDISRSHQANSAIVSQIIPRLYFLHILANLAFDSHPTYQASSNFTVVRETSERFSLHIDNMIFITQNEERIIILLSRNFTCVFFYTSRAMKIYADNTGKIYKNMLFTTQARISLILTHY